MCSSTTAERQSLASRDRTCCLRRCLPARPLRFYGFRGSMAHPTQSLCTLRTRRRRRPRNTRYRAPATAYPDRSLTGRTTPAFLAHKQSIASPGRKNGLLRRYAPRKKVAQKRCHTTNIEPQTFIQGGSVPYPPVPTRNDEHIIARMREAISGKERDANAEYR